MSEDDRLKLCLDLRKVADALQELERTVFEISCQVFPEGNNDAAEPFEKYDRARS
jgi:hypothetical protein